MNPEPAADRPELDQQSAPSHDPEAPTKGTFWEPSGQDEGHPRRWSILGVLVVSLLVVVLDNTVLNIALPTIQADLHASPSALVWAVDSYILSFAALLFTWGVLGDRYGRKRILMIGLSLFAVASAICAFSETTAMLIGFRALMGVGGAAVLPVTLAIITVVFPRQERGKAIGTWAGAVGAAVALGPVLGGILLQHPSWSEWLTQNSWGSVFLINVPIVAIGLVGIARVVPETRNPHPQRLDLTGLAVSIVGLVLLIYGIIHASATKDWLAPSVVIPIVIGVLIIALFIYLEYRSDHRSFDVSLFQNRGWAVSLSAVSLSFFALSGITFSLPFYLQTLRGFDTLQAGFCFLPFAVGQLLAAPRSAGVVAKVGNRVVITTGLLLVAVSSLGLALIKIDTPLWIALVVFFIFGFGMGNVIAPASTVMQNALPLARAGAGSAVQNTVRQVFGALGVAVIGTMLATTYANNLTPSLSKLGVSPEIQAKATDSVVMTAQILKDPHQLGLSDQQASLVVANAPVIKENAFVAFLDAMHLTSWVSVGVMLLAALVVALMLPKGLSHRTDQASALSQPTPDPAADVA